MVWQYVGQSDEPQLFEISDVLFDQVRADLRNTVSDDAFDGTDGTLKTFGWNDSPGRRFGRRSVGIQQRKYRLRTLPLRQTPQRSLESSQPLVVIIDAGDAVTITKEPIDDDIQRYAVVPVIDDVVGVKTRMIGAADRCNGAGDEVHR